MHHFCLFCVKEVADPSPSLTTPMLRFSADMMTFAPLYIRRKVCNIFIWAWVCQLEYPQNPNFGTIHSTYSTMVLNPSKIFCGQPHWGQKYPFWGWPLWHWPLSALHSVLCNQVLHTSLYQKHVLDILPAISPSKLKMACQVSFMGL